MWNNSSSAVSVNSPLFTTHDSIYILVMLVLSAILFVTGIVLNVLVCFVMIRSKRHKKTLSNLFITHLAITDIIFRLSTPGLVYNMIRPLDTISKWDHVICVLSSLVFQICCTATFASLSIIALDRYLHIIYPLKALKRKPKPWLVVLFLWMYSLIASAMYIVTLKILKNQVDGMGETSCDIENDVLGSITIIVYVTLTFIVPVVTMTFAYTSIFVTLSRRCRSGFAANATKAKIRSARMLVLVVSNMIICWGPLMFHSLLVKIGVSGYDKRVSLLVFIATITLQFMASVINPILYSLYNKAFKDDLQAVCCC
ncbi:predicted protein [Nematostella vectensis]|uniref:G-protein coupled receptors family 1 profile domain-containing protein n=1 Tax=Nematostella vectensis TaxID=45351 RepID=A7S7W2_NEMVE|nr:histamine H2 receptor [Nematostella vectensis]EDO40145.1 predicted protein [Nematostella vectensis]|eukprot:XP_001632208.1 predicted protein [Nematostella vectensis]